MLLTVARQSLLSRKKTVFLTFLSLTISMMVLFSVEHIRLQAKESFNRTISGTDLIVGAPSGQLNLLLYSVFRIGNPTNVIQYQSFKDLENNKLVKWAVPISLGDSHKGFRVLGTNQAYFTHYKYGDKRNLSFAQGSEFNSLFETVVGADVAQQLGYKVGEKIVIAHGIGSTSFTNHTDSPFIITGILARTGTPVDKTVHVSLPAIEAIHLPPSALKKLVADPTSIDIEVNNVTAVLLGLENKFATFALQRTINNYKNDRLMAVLPGVALTELWTLVGTLENLLRVIAGLVLLSALFGLSTMLLASMNERQTEIAVFRVLGAGPVKIMLLIYLETLLLTLISVLAAVSLLSLGFLVFKEQLAAEYGLFISANIFSVEILQLIAFVFVAALVTAIFPSLEAYKSALHKQLSSRR
ncbi:MAG: ABC transporter permease [Gammaproteobacteria bacterium]|nr:ABC transporter permease [Gammaproteobacteria bacterium]